MQPDTLLRFPPASSHLAHVPTACTRDPIFTWENQGEQRIARGHTAGEQHSWEPGPSVSVL